MAITPHSLAVLVIGLGLVRRWCRRGLGGGLLGRLLACFHLFLQRPNIRVDNVVVIDLFLLLLLVVLLAINSGCIARVARSLCQRCRTSLLAGLENGSARLTQKPLCRLRVLGLNGVRVIRKLNHRQAV